MHGLLDCLRRATDIPQQPLDMHVAVDIAGKTEIWQRFVRHAPSDSVPCSLKIEHRGNFDVNPSADGSMCTLTWLLLSAAALSVTVNSGVPGKG